MEGAENLRPLIKDDDDDSIMGDDGDVQYTPQVADEGPQHGCCSLLALGKNQKGTIAWAVGFQMIQVVGDPCAHAVSMSCWVAAVG